MTPFADFGRFALAATFPAAVFAGLLTFLSLNWFLPVFLILWVPLVALRGPLHRRPRPIGSAALAYGIILASLPVIPWVGFLIAVNDGYAFDLGFFLGSALITVVGWAMVVLAATLGFGLPSAMWLREVHEKLTKLKSGAGVARAGGRDSRWREG